MKVASSFEEFVEHNNKVLEDYKKTVDGMELYPSDR